MKKIILLIFVGFIWATDLGVTTSKWSAMIETKNNEKKIFSSPKAMFEYIFLEYNFQNSLEKVYVTDYKSGNFIDAKDAFFVFGSRVLSDNGDDLVAFSNKKDANEFMLENNASAILEYPKINPRLIEFLNER